MLDLLGDTRPDCLMQYGKRLVFAVAHCLQTALCKTTQPGGNNTSTRLAVYRALPAAGQHIFTRPTGFKQHTAARPETPGHKQSQALWNTNKSTAPTCPPVIQKLIKKIHLETK